ncbi:MAG: DHA2 family efflux MFS transporter permease subunit [Coriobacteriales bacterium]|jgi:DHA2 family multidrug resistance protein-like MFS transporter
MGSLALTSKQKNMVVVLLAGALLVVLNATMLSPALPHIMRDTGVDATTVQWLTSAYSLVEAVVIPLNAFLVGRFSTRKLFVGGMLWFGAACLIASFSPNFTILLASRVMMAIATGVIMPMTFSLILMIFPREQRGSAMGIVGLIISFAPAIGPSLSGFIVDGVGWRMLFVIVAVLAFCIFILAAITLKNFEGFERVPFDLLSSILLLVGMVSLLYGISDSTKASIVAVPIALIIFGLVMLALFVRRQTKLESPLLRVEVLKSRKFRTAVILMALLQAALIGSEVVLPIYVQQVMGQTATVSGLLMLPGAVIGAICGLIAGRLFDRYGIRKIVLFGAVVLACGGFGVTLFNMDMTILFVTLAYSTMSIGIQFLSTPINTWGINSLDNKLVPHGNALSATTNQVGGSVGSAFLASLTALSSVFAPAGADVRTVTFTGVHCSFIGMFCLLICVVIGVIFFVREKPSEVEAERAARPQFAYGTPGVDRAFYAGDIMDPEPGFVSVGATVRDAIKIMRSRNTSGVPIVDENKAPVGFISDGDILKYLSRQTGTYFSDGTNFYSVVDQDDFWARLKELLELDVMRIATKRVVSIEIDADVEDAFKALSEKRIKKVPVVQDDKLVGTLSRSNIITALETAEEIVDAQARTEAA